MAVKRPVEYCGTSSPMASAAQCQWIVKGLSMWPANSSPPVGRCSREATMPVIWWTSSCDSEVASICAVMRMLAGGGGGS